VHKLRAEIAGDSESVYDIPLIELNFVGTETELGLSELTMDRTAITNSFTCRFTADLLSDKWDAP
jgi:hypothetical protein